LKKPSKFSKEIENNILSFLDTNDKEKIEFFYDDGKITQIRFLLEDSNSQIVNKQLIISKTHFEDFATLFYEKHFYKNNIKTIEYYSQDEMDSYFEIEKTNEYKITKGFSPKGKMFSREKIEYNNKGKAITEEQLIYNADGTKMEYKINL
jgi:hypothetical protein